MKHCISIIFLFIGIFAFGQNSDEEEGRDLNQDYIQNSAQTVFAPEKGGTYQWNYDNQSQFQGELDKTYNQYFWLNHSLKSQGQTLSQIQANPVLNNLINQSLTEFPNTFESNFMQYVHSGKTTEHATYLLNAYELDRSRTEIYDELLEYSEWTGNETMSFEIASKIKLSEKYDEAIYSYSIQLLNTIPPGSYLITSGELETITGKVIQLVDGKYKGVTIIRKNWLEEGRYSVERLLEMGLEWSDLTDDLEPAIQRLITSNPDKSFYLSLTLPLHDFNYMLSQLYLVGLSYKYSETKVNNMDIISSNWNSFELVQTSMYQSSEWGRKMISNYLLSGIKLHEYYTNSGNKKKAKKIKDKLIEIAKICNKEDQVKLML